MRSHTNNTYAYSPSSAVSLALRPCLHDPFVKSLLAPCFLCCSHGTFLILVLMFVPLHRRPGPADRRRFSSMFDMSFPLHQLFLRFPRGSGVGPRREPGDDTGLTSFVVCYFAFLCCFAPPSFCFALSCVRAMRGEKEEEAAHFITYRNNLNKILVTPYSKQKWEMEVTVARLHQRDPLRGVVRRRIPL